MQSLHPSRIGLVVEIQLVILFSGWFGLNAILVKKVYDAGMIVENTTYSPYGEILSGGTLSRFNSEGKEYDSVVGDYDFNFRKYKPEWGLFAQPDTLIQNVYDPQSLNRYMFERGNPYNRVDPTGHVVQWAAVIYYTAEFIAEFGLFIFAVFYSKEVTKESYMKKDTQIQPNAIHAADHQFVDQRAIPSSINTATPEQIEAMKKAMAKEGFQENNLKEKKKLSEINLPITFQNPFFQITQESKQQNQGKLTKDVSASKISGRKDDGSAAALKRFWDKKKGGK